MNTRHLLVFGLLLTILALATLTNASPSLAATTHPPNNYPSELSNHRAELTWLGTAGDARWSNPANWDGGRISGPSVITRFPAGSSDAVAAIASDSGTLPLQFTSSGHVLGFAQDGVYVAGGAHVLHVQFANAQPTTPFSATSASQASPPQGLSAAAPNQSVTPKGIVLDYQNAVVYIVDAATNAVTGPFLSGVASGFLDVVLTPDQNTAILSDYYGKKVFFADISNVNNPTILGFVTFSNTPSASNPFYPEDLAISPSGKYVVVSDGGGCGYPTVNLGVASIDVPSRNLVQYLTLASPKQAQNVSVDQLGNVFVGDYCNRKLYLLRVNSDGTLTDTGVEFTFSFSPLNSYVSPDSSRLFVVGSGGVTVFQINGTGSITKILENTTIGSIQSMAFSTDGTKVFLGDYSTSPNRIIVANTNDLTVITTVNLLTSFPTGFYGVDVMSVEPSGQKLYIGNMCDATCGTATNQITVLNLNDYSLSTIDLASNSLPTSIAFRGAYRFDLHLPVILRGY